IVRSPCRRRSIDASSCKCLLETRPKPFDMSQEGLAVIHESLLSRSKNRCDLIEQVFGRREQLELQTEISTLPHDSHVELSGPPLFVQRGRCIVEPGVVEIATEEIRELPSTTFFVLEFCLLPFVLDRLFSFVVEFGPCPSVSFLEPEQLRDFSSKRIVPPRNERTSMGQVREIIARSLRYSGPGGSRFPQRFDRC